MVDLVAAQGALEAEEKRCPRLPEEDEQRATSIQDSHQRRLWRTSHIALRIVLERFGGPGLRRVPFRLEAGGRPMLPEGAPHFSISHTQGYALIAVAASPVGVDLEAATRKLKMSDDRRQRIVSAAASFDEAPKFSAGIDADVLLAWVRLEAVAKLRGSGIGRLLTEHGVVGGAAGEVPTSPAHEVAVRNLDVGPTHVAAVAARELPPLLKVTHLSADEIEAFLSGGKS